METQIAKIMVVQEELEKLKIQTTRGNVCILYGCQSILDGVVSELRNIYIESNMKKEQTEGDDEGGNKCTNK